MALSGHVLIRGWDVTPRGLSLWGWQGWGERKRLGPGEVAAGLAQGRWLQALQAAGGQAATQQHLFPCLQHPDKVLEAGFSSPLAPLGFLLPCVLLLLVFPSRAAALLLTLSASPGAARCWSASVLPVPKPKPSPHFCSDLRTPSLELPQQHISIHPILFEAL